MTSKDEKIINDFYSGMTVIQLSKKYGLSRQGIYNVFIRNKIGYKKEKKKYDIEKIRSDLKYNSVKKTMDMNKISYYDISKIMKNENIFKNEIMKDILNVEDVDRLYNKQGFNDEKIAKIYNCSKYTVRAFRWKNGIYKR